MTSKLSEGVAIIIVIATGILTFVLLFVFAKRQIMRFTLRTRRGPHYPIGVESPKHLRREIERRFDMVANTKQEPQLLHDGDTLADENACHYYRMKAVDDLATLESCIIEGKDLSKRRPRGQDLRFYLFKLAKEGEPLHGCDSKLIHQFVDAYNHARHEPMPPFGKEEYEEYMSLLHSLRDYITKKGPKRVNLTPAHKPGKDTHVALNGKTTVTVVSSDNVANEADTNETSV